MSLKIIPRELCLLSLLVEELARLSSEHRKKTLVILPTQRLMQYLSASLSKESISPPSIVTLDGFISRFSQTGKNDVVVPAQIIEWLIESLIKDGAFKHLQRGHAHEVCELFSQLEDFEDRLLIFARLQSIIRKDVYKDETHVGSLIERIDELRTLHQTFVSTLKERNVKTKNQFAIAAIENITTCLDEQQLPWFRIYVAGLTTAKTFQKKFLRFLAGREGVQLWFSEPPGLVGTVNPLKDFIDSFISWEKEGQTGQDTEFSFDHAAKPMLGMDAGEHCHIIEADSISSEVEMAFSSVTSFMEKGIALPRIGLLVSDEKAYGPYIESSLSKLKIPANLAIAKMFSHTQLGSWLLTLSKLLEDPDDNAMLKQALFHPLSRENFLRELTLPSEETFRFQSMVNASLSEVKAWRDHDFEDAKVAQLFDHLKQLLNTLLVSKKRQVSDWTLEFQNIGEAFGKLSSLLSDEHSSVTPSEKAACKELFDSLKQWGTLWKGRLTRQEFVKAITAKIQSLETRSIGFPHSGLQILNIVEARYVPFDAMIILGCSEGRFPKALPGDRLIDDSLKVKAGLPGWHYIEALEDTTFHLLRTQARHFVFLYHRAENSSRSRFLERMLNLNQAQFLSAETKNAEPKTILANENSGITPRTAGHFKPDRVSLFSKVSAHSLETLFSCPYRFLLEKLGVREQREDIPAVWEGRYLHQVLEAFFTGRTDNKTLVEPLPLRLRLPDEKILSFAQDRLETLSKEILPESLRQSPFYLHLQHFSWPRFAEHWRKCFEPCGQGLSQLDLSHDYKEYALSVDGHCLHPESNLETQITGKLDSLAISKHGFVLSDYKRKKTDSVKDVSSGVSPQLPLYALAMEFDLLKHWEHSLDHGLTGYWSILEGQWHARGVGEHIKAWALDKKLATSQTPQLTKQVEQVKRRWQEACERFLKRDEPLSPTPGPHCDTCTFSGICRKNDPGFTH